MNNPTHQTATGGTVTTYPWGLVHTAGPKYTGQIAEKEDLTKMSKDSIMQSYLDI